MKSLRFLWSRLKHGCLGLIWLYLFLSFLLFLNFPIFLIPQTGGSYYCFRPLFFVLNAVKYFLIGRNSRKRLVFLEQAIVSFQGWRHPISHSQWGFTLCYQPRADACPKNGRKKCYRLLIIGFVRLTGQVLGRLGLLRNWPIPGWHPLRS